MNKNKKIWDICCQNEPSALNETEFYLFLRLISVYQNESAPSVSNLLSKSLHLPKFNSITLARKSKNKNMLKTEKSGFQVKRKGKCLPILQ